MASLIASGWCKASAPARSSRDDDGHRRPLHDRGAPAASRACSPACAAISAVVGPLAGAIIVDTVAWAWIFWINIPLGILATLGFITYLKEAVERRRASIDYLGAALFSVAIVSLLVI